MATQEKKKIIASLLTNSRPPQVGAYWHEENEDEDDTFNTLLFLFIKTCAYRTRGPRPSVPRLLGYSERVVPRYTTRTFQSHFRLEPHVMDYLENLLSPDLMREGAIGRFTISPRKQLLCSVWILVTPDSYRSVGEKFGMSKGSLHDCVCRVVDALNKITRQQIVWPQGTEKDRVKYSFLRVAGIPNIVGAIDGCHINIEAPNEHPFAYRTGKKRYAIQLQAVCTADLLFTDCFAGYPASVHDARVLRNSPLLRDSSQLFNNEEFIIGDKAYYPIRTWCIPPYKDNGHLTQAQKHFNKCHAKTRQIIERTFALLKGRFRRLKFLPMLRTDRMPFFIMACCTLHNICRRKRVNDPIEEYIREGVSDEIASDDEETFERDEVAGVAKRDYLKDLLWQQRTA